MSSSRRRKDGAPAVEAASSTNGGPPRRNWTGRSRTTIAGVVALGLTTAGLTAVPAMAINSNPPTGPGTIEIFPMRDMIAIDGYTDQAGKTATFTATRAGQVIGKTTGTVGADGFLEANHPGGVCWGVGSGAPQVTPDLQAGDEVRVDFSDGTWDGSKVVDVEATGVVLDDVKHTLTVNGRYGPGVDMPGTDLLADPGKAGIEIVNPDRRPDTRSTAPSPARMLRAARSRSRSASRTPPTSSWPTPVRSRPWAGWRTVTPPWESRLSTV
jgi:hypothetical protein